MEVQVIWTSILFILALFTRVIHKIKKEVLKHCFKTSFAVRTGLEPVTPCVTGMYSNQLN